MSKRRKAYMEAPLIVDKPVDKPVEKRARTEKQLANDEKMRVAALAQGRRQAGRQGAGTGVCHHP